MNILILGLVVLNRLFQVRRVPDVYVAVWGLLLVGEPFADY